MESALKITTPPEHKYVRDVDMQFLIKNIENLIALRNGYIISKPISKETEDLRLEAIEYIENKLKEILKIQ